MTAPPNIDSFMNWSDHGRMTGWTPEALVVAGLKLGDRVVWIDSDLGAEWVSDHWRLPAYPVKVRSSTHRITLQGTPHIFSLPVAYQWASLWGRHCVVKSAERFAALRVELALEELPGDAGFESLPFEWAPNSRPRRGAEIVSAWHALQPKAHRFNVGERLEVVDHDAPQQESIFAAMLTGISGPRLMTVEIVAHEPGPAGTVIVRWVEVVPKREPPA
jgi:hypothetical protein